MVTQVAMRVFKALLLLFPAWLFADSGAYRVELMVFSHLDTGREAIEAQELRGFGDAFALDGELLERNPDDPAPLGVMSDMMQDIWRRLESSAVHQPLLFKVWEQSRIDYHPPVRIHDGDLLEERLLFPGGLAFLDLRNPAMLDAYRSPFYALDGTVQLRRSRFLHLDLDLEWRQALLPDGAPLPASLEEAVMAAERPAPGMEQLAEPMMPGPALVHGLRQSRQIRTGQLQYFDSPVLGVLARVTATAGE
ncbi:MAG: hypothetical protein GWM87_06500 [Xanthomonadales bacterium]|nr:hypothetical protein [Xanthomonadales bacterium]NIX12619.1 hypothetical protein [Xanthomonadales bacterium]